ncbi:hypothetical protein [Streptomyces sp. NPDC096105]|uniref:hypothetical protein n=1 Tax=Streptomyces sp. NPDC096105 TaxID=3366074 RepID=UPI0038158FDC
MDRAWQSFAARFTAAELPEDSAAPHEPGPAAEEDPAPPGPPEPAREEPPRKPPPAPGTEVAEDGVPVRPAWLYRDGLS